MERYAAIDVGTNSVLLLIAEEKSGRLVPLQEAFTITRLGVAYAHGGRIPSLVMGRTLKVLESYLKIARTSKCQQVYCFGTQVLREASNASNFVALALEHLALDIQVLSKDEEAHLTFLGARDTLMDNLQSIWVLDIGGGSTECIFGDEKGIQSIWSFPVGGVNLKEKFHVADRISPALRREIETFLGTVIKSLPIEEKKSQLVGVGGTLTTLATLDLKLSKYDFQQVDGYYLPLDKIRKIYHDLNAITLKERENLTGLESGRADIILPATLLLIHLMKKLGFSHVTVSARGLRFGFLRWKLNHRLLEGEKGTD